MSQFLRVPRTSQPQDGTEIDWSNPLTFGLYELVGYRGATRIVDFIRGAFSGYNGYGINGVNETVTRVGRGWISTTGGYGDNFIFPSVDGDDHTIFCLAVPLVSSPVGTMAQSMASGAFQQNGQLQFGNNRVQALCNSNVTLESDATVTPHVPVFAVVTNNRTIGLQEFWVNGAKQTAVGASTSQRGFTTDTFRMGNNSNNTMAYVLAGGYNRILTDVEIISLSTNPWQLFEPQLVRVPLSASAPAGETKYLSASINQVSSLTGQLSRTRRVAATVTEAASVSGTVSRSRRLAAVISESEVVTGTLARTRRLASTVAQSSSVSGVLRRTRALAAGISQSSTVAAVLRRTRNVSAVVSQASTITVGAFSKIKTLSASIAQTLNITVGSISKIKTLSASVAQSLTVAASAVRTRFASATVSQSESVSASVARQRTLAASIAETSEITANLSRTRALAAAILETEGITVESVERVRNLYASIDETLTITASFGGDITPLPDTVIFTVQMMVWQVVDGELQQVELTDSWTYTKTAAVTLELPAPVEVDLEL